MPKYIVWDPMNHDEEFALEEGGKWASYEAWNPRDAAHDYGDHIIESGDSEALSGFDVHVRDLETRKLYKVEVTYDFDPTTVTGRPVELAESADSKAVG